MPDVPEVLAQILARPAINGVRLVAIDGPGGAGKSTFAGELAAAADAPIVEIDDFISWLDLSDWWPRLEQQVIEPLLAGRDAHYQQRDWTGDEFGDSLGEWATLPWAPLVILEGITSARRAVADRLAYAVWVEAPREVCLSRGLSRDGGETRRELWTRWQLEEDQWFAADGTRERADLVISTG
ncbi:MAG: uridine kinase [Mycobacteriales bacterium]